MLDLYGLYSEKMIRRLIKIGLISYAGYLIYQNRNKIKDKLRKLKRMNSLNAVFNDLVKTGNKAITNLSSLSIESLDYIKSFIGIKSLDPFKNKKFLEDINKPLKDVDLYKGNFLRSSAIKLVLDINKWNTNDDYRGTYTEIGKMPLESFRFWDNLYKSNNDDFIRIVKMVNVLLSYNYPNVGVNDEPNINSKDLLFYLKHKIPSEYLQLNDVDWGSTKQYTNDKPKQVVKGLISRIEMLKRTKN